MFSVVVVDRGCSIPCPTLSTKSLSYRAHAALPKFRDDDVLELYVYTYLRYPISSELLFICNYSCFSMWSTGMRVLTVMNSEQQKDLPYYAVIHRLSLPLIFVLAPSALSLAGRVSTFFLVDLSEALCANARVTPFCFNCRTYMVNVLEGYIHALLGFKPLCHPQ